MAFTTIADAKRQTGLSYLAGLNTSAKVQKGVKQGIYTLILYLAPASESGYNVCPHSTHECRLGCLATSGRAAMELRAGKSNIMDSRIAKTRLFFEFNQFFMDWLRVEIENAVRKAKKDGFKLGVRLNGTSDIEWEKYRVYDGKNIFEVFEDVQFYDYTKHPLRPLTNEHKNYHLTLSYTGRNSIATLRALRNGVNVAVVMDIPKSKPLPSEWEGFEVVDGDGSDYRPNDAKGVVVGLRWKDIADKDASKRVRESAFVIKNNN